MAGRPLELTRRGIMVLPMLTQEEEALQRLHLAAIDKLDDEALLLAYQYGYTTDDVQIGRGAQIVKLILERRFLTRVSNETKELEKITNISRGEVKRLADSSEKMEQLTIRLKRLTWALIVLTAFAVLEPIGIEIWRAKRESNALVAPIVPQPPQPTAPQAPALPAPQSPQGKIFAGEKSGRPAPLHAPPESGTPGAGGGMCVFPRGVHRSPLQLLLSLCFAPNCLQVIYIS
jgi:hypothetical protein